MLNINGDNGLNIKIVFNNNIFLLKDASESVKLLRE